MGFPDPGENKTVNYTVGEGDGTYEVEVTVVDGEVFAPFNVTLRAVPVTRDSDNGKTAKGMPMNCYVGSYSRICHLGVFATLRPVYNGHCISRPPPYNSHIIKAQNAQILCVFQPVYTDHLFITATILGPRVNNIDSFCCGHITWGNKGLKAHNAKVLVELHFSVRSTDV